MVFQHAGSNETQEPNFLEKGDDKELFASSTCLIQNDNMKHERPLIPWLEAETPLPAPDTALRADSGLAGLVAAGGGLSVARLREAYSQGMFPWFNESQPVLWWSPDPRMVLQVEDFRLHRSMRKTLHAFIQSSHCDIKFDTAFSRVIRHCANAVRPGQDGTWIVDEMVQAYEVLHDAGFAHSVETWVDDELVGGLYCVSMGRCIFGESMFALQPNASKIALAALVAFARAQGARWIDCQQNTRHLSSLGALEIPRAQFIEDVNRALHQPSLEWRYRPIYWNELMMPRGLA